MARAGLCLALLVGAVTGFLFTVYPSLDLEIAALFYDPVARALVNPDTGVVAVVRLFNLALVGIVVGLAAAALIVRMSSANAPMLVSARAACLVLLVYLAGPGLVANAIFKENWSRPRPGHVVEFGGKQTFKPWWDPRGTCPKNCSFVSGEASAAFAILALAVIAPIGWRYGAVGAALLYGIAIGAIRVMVGGHFASDVIFAGVFTALVVWAVHGLIYRWSTRVDEHEAEKRIDAFAAGLRSRIAMPLYNAFVHVSRTWSGVRRRPSLARGAVRLDGQPSV